MDFLSGLNPQQREAVATTDGPLLILAGAGSGKTRVITHRIAHLITACNVPASTILSVTFTNKAAEEMRNRIGNILSGVPLSGGPILATFHSFCVRLLRRDGDRLASIRPGFTRTFSIYDDDDQLSIIKAAYKRMGLDDKAMPHRSTMAAISGAKSQKETPQDLYSKATDPRITKIAAVYEEYEKALRNANALDFDDLLLETVRLLYHDAEVREAWNRRLSYLMIDEYQDTNRSQYELMRLLTQRHSNVCVVGDEDQSIYSWRGADIRNILDFEKDFPNAKVIRLEQNYRSTKNILEAASMVVANNKERKGKWLWTDADEGDVLSVYPAFDSENEALFIADTTEKILRQHPEYRVAILYRTNSQSRQIEEALRRYNRPYIVVGGTSYYQRAEVKDIVAYLKVAVQQSDSVALARIINTPARGIGKTTVEEAQKVANDTGMNLWDAINHMLDTNAFGTRAHSAVNVFRNVILDLKDAVGQLKLNEALAFIEERTGYRKMLEADTTPEAQTRLENLNELMNAAAESVERGETVADFLDHAALVAQSDSLDAAAQVTLMTIHNAKGLEFPVVFMAGMEDGLFPHSRSINSEAAMEEERRLCYVGMTRAEKRLILTWAKLRRRFGGGEQERTMGSRFLKEIPPQLVMNLGVDEDDGYGSSAQVDLRGERETVRTESRKNLYTGKTYNSLENISAFFKEKGINVPVKVQPGTHATAPPVVSRPKTDLPPWETGPGPTPLKSPTPITTGRPAAPTVNRPLGTPAPVRPIAPPAARPAGPPPSLRPQQTGLFGDGLLPPVQSKSVLPKAPPPPKSPPQTGTVVEHPKYGTGTLVRREGDGADAKVVVVFQRYGMKKLVEKFANLKKV